MNVQNEKYERQMKKGVLDMLVLKLLESDEKYGYQLISELNEKSDGVFILKEGTLCDAILITPQNGDIYVLCSDGVNKGLSDINIEKIVKKNLSAGKIAHEIVKTSAHNDGKDNVSCVVIKIVASKEKSFFKSFLTLLRRQNN